jgi:hypothetical protein
LNEILQQILNEIKELKENQDSTTKELREEMSSTTK